MRDTNAKTEHSKELRKKTAAERRERILLEGGSDFRALIEREHVLKLESILKWEQMGGRTKANKTSVFRKMIDNAYSSLPKQARGDKLDQIDLLGANPSTARNIRGRTGSPSNTGKSGSVDSKATVQDKYQLNGQAWSGRGRKPMWLLNYLDQGGSLDDLAIDKD